MGAPSLGAGSEMNRAIVVLSHYTFNQMTSLLSRSEKFIKSSLKKANLL